MGERDEGNTIKNIHSIFRGCIEVCTALASGGAGGSPPPHEGLCPPP